MSKRKPLADARKKYTIFYTRDFRHFSKAGYSNIILVLVFAVIIFAFYLYNYSHITYLLSKWAGDIIQSVTGAEYQVIAKDYFPTFGPVHIIDMAGTTPSLLFSIITAVVAIVLIVIFSVWKSSWRSIAIYLCMGGYILLISAIFFIFVPEYFPYSLTNYSELYMKQQVILWMTVPTLGGVAIFLLGGKWLSGYLTFGVIIAVSFVFGCLRYVVNMYLLYVGSSIFMASLFFTFGVLFDFLQMVSIYTIYVRYISTRMQSLKNRSAWQW